MVFEDIAIEKEQNPKWHAADPIERFFAFCLDITLLTPIIAFVCSIHMREIENDIAQGFDSGLWFSLLTTGLFSSISLQSIFLYFYSATPGQAMLNLKVQSLESETLTWGDAFTRSIAFHFSGLLLFLPFIEVFTHRIGRCLHDRISDSIVIQPYPKSQKPLTTVQI
ncbi:MAG: RDD family protein, partial [Bdellovibrionales bacterium]